MPILIQTTLSAISWLYADVLFGSADVISLPISNLALAVNWTRFKQIHVSYVIVRTYAVRMGACRAGQGSGSGSARARAFQVKRNQLYSNSRSMAGRAERAALCASCISMVTMFFAHGPTVLTNRVRCDTKRQS